MLFAEIVCLAEIIGVNLLLSGDNAILVGMAVRNLAEHQRKVATVVGVTAASLIQIGATLALASFLSFPAISLIGGILLAWIAVRFLNEDRSAQKGEASPHTLWKAISIVLVAYVIVCLDNVLAVAAIGRGYPLLLASGLAISCAIVIPASIAIADLMRRFPLLVFLGAGVLGWTAGGLVVSDAICRQALDHLVGIRAQRAALGLAPAFFATLVVVSPWWHKR